MEDFSFLSGDTINSKPTVAISACLFGEAVRYDGKEKQLNLLSLLEENLNLISLCPEVGAGMSTPRPPIELTKTKEGIIAIGKDDNTLNPTKELKRFAEVSFNTLNNDIIGYVFKSRSPSCGLNSTPVFVKSELLSSCARKPDSFIEIGSGFQADYFSKNAPHLIFTEDSDLQTEEDCLRYIFTCRLALDVKNAATNGETEELYQHYQPFFKELPEAIQHLLNR